MMPLDVINEVKGKTVVVELVDGKIVEGILRSFDLSSNIGIEVKGNLKFISGNLVNTVSIPE